MTTSPEAAAEHLKRVCDSVYHERHGIITSLIELNESPVAPGLFVFAASMVNPMYFRQNAHTKAESTRGGSGVDFTRTGALWSTIGESIERYAASIYYPDMCTLATARDLGDRALDLSRLVLFSDEQYQRANFPFARPDPDVERYWVEATDPQTGARQFVPVELVYLAPAMAGKRKELVQSCSTGLACGQSLERATLSGLCEVIERDAFSAMWQLSYAPPRLTLDDATAERLTPAVRDYLRDGPLKITLWSLATDIGIPVLMAMAENCVHGVFALGASCRLDPADAIDKAVMEALHTFVWAQKKIDSGDPAPDVHEVRSPESHMAYWLDPTRRPMADFLFDNRVPISSGCLPAQIKTLDALLERLAGLGYPALTVDLTTEDVASLDMHVVRSLVPGLHPLVFGPDLTPEDPRRLRQLAAFWEIPFPVVFNPLPHPFP